MFHPGNPRSVGNRPGNDAVRMFNLPVVTETEEGMEQGETGNLLSTLIPWLSSFSTTDSKRPEGVPLPGGKGPTDTTHESGGAHLESAVRRNGGHATLATNPLPGRAGTIRKIIPGQPGGSVEPIPDHPATQGPAQGN